VVISTPGPPGHARHALQQRAAPPAARVGEAPKAWSGRKRSVAGDDPGCSYARRTIELRIWPTVRCMISHPLADALPCISRQPAAAGCRNEHIPLVGRIVALADVFDALTHDRPYRSAWSLEDALAEINTQRGNQFKPELVDTFLAPSRRRGRPAHRRACTLSPHLSQVYRTTFQAGGAVAGTDDRASSTPNDENRLARAAREIPPVSQVGRAHHDTG
jgi:hypothetical protein